VRDAWDQKIRKQIKTCARSFRSSRTPRTIAARGTFVLNGSWLLIAPT